MSYITTLTFTKDYQAVVEAFAKIVRNPVVTERTEAGHTVVDVEGDFTHFVLADMDTWGGHFKIEIRDNHITDPEDREARAVLAEHMPGFGAVLFSPTTAVVYRQRKVIIRTKTVTEKVVEGAVIEQQESEWQSTAALEWEEITREWGQKVPPTSKEAINQ